VKVTWNWLNDWVDLTGSPEELAQLLATRGLPVESIERGVTFDPAIVVGRVVERGQHPNADRLSLCSVDIGGAARLSIVCGAPNVAAGQKVAVAQIGSRLPDGTKLRKSKIRGVESEGMICSERELGLSDESQGIWVLPGDPPVGVPLASVVPGGDPVLDIEITSNRSDCMSVIGLAREIAAARGRKIKPARPFTAAGSDKLPPVTIENPADCPRYMARVVRGVKIGPSPDWLKRRLEATGFRSISNVVDATNYVLREHGQPIHAFDASKIGGFEIRVRRARPGEKLTLLDGRVVTLDGTHLVIADRSIPMALAGVMGGLDSGVIDATTDVVLESAVFDRALTQATARSLGIATDASARFIEGVDPVGVERALDATARLLAEIAGGTVTREPVDQWPGRAEPEPIPLSRRSVERLLGIPLDTGAITQALATLEIEPAESWTTKDGDQVARFRAPSYRHDLAIQEDLIEEVGRAVGYDAIPLRLMAAPTGQDLVRTDAIAAERLLDLATGLGFQEALTNILVGDIPDDAREGIEDDQIWELKNPMSRELKHLRVGILPGLVEAAGRNLRMGAGDVRLVEAGKVFLSTPPPLGTERFEAGLILAGTADEWDHPEADSDRYLELKGAVEALLQGFGIDSCRTATYHGRNWTEGSGASIRAEGETVAQMGEVAAALAASMGLDRPAWAAILDVAAIERAAPLVRRYRDIPRYPATKRDLAVIVPRETHHAELEDAIRKAGGALLDRVRLFDVFEGHRLGEGRKSMAYALEFRSPDRTLSDREADGAVQSIVRALEERFGAVLRGGASGRTGELT
jgi:phenylalanyl-tRNA synthetase beta chain